MKCNFYAKGHSSEWALLRRHKSEDLFGVQICGAYPDTVARAVELIDQECSVDFIDINMGCPIDIVVNKGAGSALLTKPLRMKNVIHAACASAEKPITVKVLSHCLFFTPACEYVTRLCSITVVYWMQEELYFLCLNLSIFVLKFLMYLSVAPGVYCLEQFGFVTSLLL